MDRFQKLREKYGLSNVDYSNAPKPSLQKEIKDYNSSENEKMIEILKKETQNQRNLNLLLREVDYTKQTAILDKFIQERGATVNKQLALISDLSRDLKVLIEQNKRLQYEKAESEMILHSKKAKELASKIQEIKLNKQILLHFLASNGIQIS